MTPSQKAAELIDQNRRELAKMFGKPISYAQRAALLQKEHDKKVKTELEK